MDLRYFAALVALSCNFTLFRAAAPATNVSSQPMIASTATGGSNVTVPAEPNGLELAKKIEDHAKNWNVIWAKIEANVVEAWRLKKTLLPPVEKLLEAALTPELIKEIMDEIAASDADITKILLKEPEKFNEFRNISGKGISWPLAKELRKLWEDNGYTFRGQMIDRARMVCATCEPLEPVKGISAIMPWMKPEDYHDIEKHKKAGQDVTVVPFGQQIPADSGQLLPYLMRYIDKYAYSNGKMEYPHIWNAARKVRGNMFGFAHFSSYFRNAQNPEKYIQIMKRQIIENSFPAPAQKVTGVIKW